VINACFQIEFLITTKRLITLSIPALRKTLLKYVIVCCILGSVINIPFFFRGLNLTGLVYTDCYLILADLLILVLNFLVLGN